MSQEPKCGICGEPMPEGETMFKFHGYSGPCPKPPLKKVELDPSGEPKQPLTVLEAQAIDVLNQIKAVADGGGLVDLPIRTRRQIDVILLLATVRRVGVQ